MAERKSVPETRHEPSDIALRSVMIGGAAIALGVVLAALLAYLLWRWWQAPTGAQAFGGPNASSIPELAQPRLESAPQPMRARYFAEQQQRLNAWAWIDRDAGIARIPVEVAMQVIAQDAQEETR